jgi:hypothetical protein
MCLELGKKQNDFLVWSGVRVYPSDNFSHCPANFRLHRHTPNRCRRGFYIFVIITDDISSIACQFLLMWHPAHLYQLMPTWIEMRNDQNTPDIFFFLLSSPLQFPGILPWQPAWLRPGAPSMGGGGGPPRGAPAPGAAAAGPAPPRGTPVTGPCYLLLPPLNFSSCLPAPAMAANH